MLIMGLPKHKAIPASLIAILAVLVVLDLVLIQNGW
jgi:hypothetical protein